MSRMLINLRFKCFFGLAGPTHRSRTVRVPDLTQASITQEAKLNSLKYLFFGLRAHRPEDGSTH